MPNKEIALTKKHKPKQGKDVNKKTCGIQYINHHNNAPLFFPQKILITLKQLLRYGIVGSLAFCTQFSVVLLLVHFLKFQPLLANIFGFSGGFVVSFLGHRFWTFHQSKRKMHKLFMHFLLIGLMNLALNQMLYYYFLTKLHLHYALALVIVIAIATSIVFCINKLWVFRV